MTAPTGGRDGPGSVASRDEAETPAPLSLTDVARMHRLVLGRDLDNVSAAIVHATQSRDLWDLFETLWKSPEAEVVRMSQALDLVPRFHDNPPMSLPATGDQLDKLRGLVDDHWQTRGLGRFQWWFHRHEQRYENRSRQWNLERILKAAGQEAETLLRRCARHGLTLAPDMSMTVLGVEAFRLAPFLAPQLQNYAGVELLAKDVDFARAALSHHGIANAQVLTVGTHRDAPSACDLFYSVDALLFAPPPLMAEMLEAGLHALRDGGLAYFQLPCQIHGYHFEPERYLSGESRDLSGEIHALQQHQVFSLMQRHGITPLEVVPDGALERFGISYMFVGRKGDAGSR